jgi:hypothetical protein
MAPVDAGRYHATVMRPTATRPAYGKTRAIGTGMWLFAATVPVSVLALGSLHPIVLCVMASWAALSCSLLWMHPPNRMPRGSGTILLAFAILIGATVLQAVPLPASTVAALAPANADIWGRALSPLREAGPAWHPITVAPAATHQEVLRGLFYASTFFAALRISTMEGGCAFLERVVVASVGVLALAHLAHPIIGAERVFGVYRPREIYAYRAGRYGPLLNANHLAAYLNLTSARASGLAC